MRRGMLAAVLAIAIGLAMTATAEPASAATLVTSVKGTATFSGPTTYSARTCGDPCVWTPWETYAAPDDAWTAKIAVSCFGVCFGNLRVSPVPGGDDFFFGSAAKSGNQLALSGTSMSLTQTHSGVPRLYTRSVSMTFNSDTGQGSFSSPTLVTNCVVSGWEPAFCNQLKDVQLSGSLVSGGINVTGF
ncbi:MAG: hypothetical protein IT198_09890 [Acidimicrobiia bacterium]|nr:hypothetical protein [Acidimicrobiia bacterium]